MVCVRSCAVAIVFLFSMLYMTLTIDKDKMTENLQKHFDETHVEYYKKVVKERTRIYLTGFGIGLVLSLILLFIMKYKMKKISNLVIICTCIAVSYTTMYLYYTLSPKMDLMVVQLDKKEARIAWQNYYNNMKNKYHISMLLGVVFSFLINNGLCK